MMFSVVLPCYNEEANVEQTIRDVLSWMDRDHVEGEVVAVNDGSADRTGELLDRMQAADPRVRAVHHKKNQGYGAAIRTGCDAAEGDVIGFMDSDGQFHAEDFGKLLPELRSTHFAVGVRVHRADPFNRKLNAFLYGTLVRFVLGVKVRDLNCGMKIYTRALWQKIRPVFATGALYNAELFLNAAQVGEGWAEIPVPHYPRRAGTQTGANPTVILKMFRELFALKKATKERYAQEATAR